nr:MAG TPA: 30S ribosomal protein S2 [Caudoviricetes sp.]
MTKGHVNDIIEILIKVRKFCPFCQYQYRKSTTVIWG